MYLLYQYHEDGFTPLAVSKDISELKTEAEQCFVDEQLDDDKNLALKMIRDRELSWSVLSGDEEVLHIFENYRIISVAEV